MSASAIRAATSRFMRASLLRYDPSPFAYSSIKYDAPKPDLAEEDKVIGNYKLNLKPENVKIVNADDVFAK